MSLDIVWPNLKIFECCFENGFLSPLSAGDAVACNEAEFLNVYLVMNEWAA